MCRLKQQEFTGMLIPCLRPGEQRSMDVWERVLPVLLVSYTCGQTMPGPHVWQGEWSWKRICGFHPASPKFGQLQLLAPQQICLHPIPTPLKTISTICKRPFQQVCCVWLVALPVSAWKSCLQRANRMWMKYCSAFLLQRTIKTG